MKKSTRVQLVMLGSAIGISGCDAGAHPLQQQTYSSLASCRQDWVAESNCQPVRSGSGGGGGGGYYQGPRYYWDPDRGRPVAVNPDGSLRVIANARITAAGSTTGSTRIAGSISRGGFGASAHDAGGGE